MQIKIVHTIAILVIFTNSMVIPQSIGSYAKENNKLSISCGAVGIELKLCNAAVEIWSKNNGVKVEIIPTPNSSAERMAMYQQILANQSNDIDIMQVDVVWPRLLSAHTIDLHEYDPDAGKGHFREIIQNNTVDDKLLALPWWTELGLLYYRKDLLKKYHFSLPSTWEEMRTTAKAIMEKERAAGNRNIWGYVWQGRNYEGLTCNALEWLVSYGGGTIVDNDGKSTINNQQAVKALQMAASWIGDITPKGVLNYDEEESRGVFQSGNAVFMRNWSYAWALLQSKDSPVRDKVGVVVLPKGGANGNHTSTLGGWNLSVSKYSKNPRLAVDLVKFLTNPAQQKLRAMYAYNPTYPQLYEDTELLEINPFFSIIKQALSKAVFRPSARVDEYYNRLSYQFWSAIHNILSGEKDPGFALLRLENSLNHIKRHHGRL
ncbi:ABC transporter substrate-binding protein [Candidatus Endolissoclinum faulkneri]|uniref:ABC transporter substrate-binding protein n=1 Tax=Candidatus Endolissoclinum faulkneri TaxID=1263979 RepID=UPI0011825467|nr:ABC transporter substrate-binding protein [Candidatus Endolissoclinum faulkneri]